MYPESEGVLIGDRHYRLGIVEGEFTFAPVAMKHATDDVGKTTRIGMRIDPASFDGGLFDLARPVAVSEYC